MQSVYVNRTEIVLPKGNIPFDPDNRTQTISPYANMSLQTLGLLGQPDAYYGNLVKFIQFEGCPASLGTAEVMHVTCNFLYELKFVAKAFEEYKSVIQANLGICTLENFRKRMSRTFFN